MSKDRFALWQKQRDKAIPIIKQKMVLATQKGNVAKAKAKVEGETEEVKKMMAEYHALKVEVYKDSLQLLEEGKTLYPEFASDPDTIESIALTQVKLEEEEQKLSKYL